MTDCTFCEIVAGEHPADIVLDEPEAVAFLDQHPVFPGHVLLVPRLHVEALDDLPPGTGRPPVRRRPPPEPCRPGGRRSRRLLRGGEQPHQPERPPPACAHPPRRRHDGLRGFFWPRLGYEDEVHRRRTAQAIKAALAAGR